MIKILGKILKYRKQTLKYPDKPMDNRLFIGKPVINNELCVGCKTCIKECPSKAIDVKEVSKDGQKKEVVGINLDQCIFCVRCEDVCKKGAIKMSNEFELAVKDRNELRHTPIVIEERTIPNESYEIIGQKIKDKSQKIFGRSLQIREVDAGSCNGCDYEINALNNPFNDAERFGIHFVASPRHADMLLVTGTATRNMELALIKTYNATPDPKMVIAVGACGCSGGIFRDSYATRNGIDTIVPVDVYVPGCPPRPQAVLYGILKAMDRLG